MRPILLSHSILGADAMYRIPTAMPIPIVPGVSGAKMASDFIIFYKGQEGIIVEVFVILPELTT